VSARVPGTLEGNKGWIYVFGVNFTSRDCRPKSRGITESWKSFGENGTYKKTYKTKRFVKK